MTYLFLSLFLFANFSLLAFDLLIVLLSYSIFWYEYSNNHPASYDQRFNRRSFKLGVSLIFPEFFFNFVTVIVSPFGLFNIKSQDLTRGETPVLLLHGLFDNRASWFWFKKQLKQRGINNVITINLSSWHSEEILTELLSKRIDELRHQLGVNKVNLVGHSMGGIIARNYIQLREGENKIDKLVCLGSPHAGSKLATFSVSPLGRHLIPGSAFLQRLNSAPHPTQVTTTNIYSKKDNMVFPNNSCHLSWGQNIELDGMGHTSLIYRTAAVDAVSNALKKVPVQ
jgi:triacylglycerol lipase